MSRHGSRNNALYAKAGFLLGLGLFVAGAGGELLGPALFGPLPAWEHTLLFDMEVLGILIGFFAPFVFAIVLPLVE